MKDTFKTKKDETYFMKEALKQAKMAFNLDEVPIGAVIVHQNKIIARAHNQVEMLKDPTAHAEMLVLTEACNFLQNKWLLDCDIYVTIEPCSMCAGALVLSRIKRIIYGADDPKAGACLCRRPAGSTSGCPGRKPVALPRPVPARWRCCR